MNIFTKTGLCAALAALTGGGALAQSTEYDETFRQAVQGAVAEAKAALAATDKVPGDAALALLPIDGDGDGWIAGLLKIALTDSGKTCVTAKEEPLLAEILKEVEWDERKADILDAKTVDRFGKLKSAQALVTAHARHASKSGRYVFFELELHVTSIATKAHLWGGVFAKRYYVPSDEVQGLVKMPVQAREAMQKLFREKAASSLKAAAKLKGLKTVAFLPVASDVDGYVGNSLRNAFADTALVTKNLDLATMGEARILFRDLPPEQKDGADAICSAVLRDFSSTLVSTTPNSKTYRIVADVQACIEKASSREQLWSDTILVSTDFTETLGWWDLLCSWFPFLRTSPWLLVVVPVVVIVGLFALLALLGAMTRVR